MSWTDNELDNLVREAAASSQVEYKDAYWQEMEAMLGEKKASKFGLLWWMSGVTLLIGISTVFVTSIVQGSHMNDQATASLMAKNQERVAMNNKPTTQTSMIEVNNTANNTPIKTSSATLTATSNPNNASIDATENGSARSSFNHSSFSNKKDEQLRNNVNLHGEVENGTVAAMNGHQSIGGEEGAELNASRAIESQRLNQSNSNNESELDLSKLTVKEWSANIAYAPINPMNELPLIANKRVGFYVGINGGIGQSYSMTADNNAMYQVGLNGGLEFYRKNWAFGTGLGIRQQNVQNLNVINNRRMYSFGAVNVNQNITYDRLLFADVVLAASYRFGRSELGFSAVPTYLLGARMSATQSTEEIIGTQKITENESQVKRQYVSSENFNAFGLNVGLNYNYSLVRNISIQAGVNVRVLQPLLQTNFEGDQRNMPVMVELGLKKRF